MGGIFASAYFIYLAVLVCRALWQIYTKRRLLPALQPDQRTYYGGLIYRFTALLVYTILCAALTVIFFIFSQVRCVRVDRTAIKSTVSTAFCRPNHNQPNSLGDGDCPISSTVYQR